MTGIPNLQGHARHQVAGGGHMEDHGEDVVGHINIVLGDTAARHLPEIHPDRRPVQRLKGLPDQEIPPAGPGEGKQRDEPDDELG
ncbi:hypothetical protein D3C85_1846510 [compost metagenome]